MLVTSATKPEAEAIEYQLIHSTIGRFRLRVPRIGTDSEYAKKLNWLVESLDFVTDVRLNPHAEAVIVNYDTTAVADEAVQENLLSAIQQASIADIPIEAIPEKPTFTPEINLWERMGLPVATLGLALLAEQLLLPIPAILVGGMIIAAAAPFVSRVVDTTLKQKRLDGDILDALWIGVQTVKGDLVAPALMISMLESGEVMRDATARTSERQALNLLDTLDQYTWVEQDGQERRIDLKDVQVGDRIVVYPGELIPVSGRVLRGAALIDEHKLTGESTLVSRSEGQVVHASTLVLEGKLCILAKRIGKNTRVGVAFELMQSAPVHDTRVEDYAAKIANAMIMPTLCVSGAIFAFTGDFARAIAPLQLDFSHGIRLSVPTTILAAMTHAARHSVYIRSGRAIEMLARVDTIVFDKTGTLTQGNVAVVAIQPANPQISTTTVLSLAASVEQGNTHPFASAIMRYAEANNVQTRKCKAWQYQIGMGITALIDGQKILVGSDRLMQQEGINLDSIHQRYPHVNAGTHSRAYVAQEGELLGVILYTDPLRPESAQTVANLHSQGMETYIISGDHQRVAADVAEKLGIDPMHTYAQAFPDHKVEVVRQLQDQGRVVAFVGEGINDAAALVHADVSVSLAVATDLARETADVVLMDNDLRGLVMAIAIAKQVMEIVYQNTAIVAVPNISVVLAGIFFALDPVLAVIVSNGAMLVAEMNSFRPLLADRKDVKTDVLQR